MPRAHLARARCGERHSETMIPTMRCQEQSHLPPAHSRQAAERQQTQSQPHPTGGEIQDEYLIDRAEKKAPGPGLACSDLTADLFGCCRFAMTKDCFQVIESIKCQRARRVFHTNRMAAHDGKALLPFDQPCLPVYSQISFSLSRDVSCAVLPSHPGERGGSARTQLVAQHIAAKWSSCPLGANCLDVSHGRSDNLGK